MERLSDLAFCYCLQQYIGLVVELIRVELGYQMGHASHCLELPHEWGLEFKRAYIGGTVCQSMNSCTIYAPNVVAFR
jgi:hypothetical protein